MKQSRHAAAALVAALLEGGCGPGLVPDSSETVEWLRNDPRRCLIPRDLSQKLETHAVRCAERFLAENGYTEEVAAIDPARLAAERGERDVSAGVLEQRFASLEARAAMVQGSGRECFVFFGVRDVAQPCRLRAVLMTWVFTRMRVRPGTVADVRCARAPQA